ncbi:MAG: hypothetical protein JWP49_1018 [Phenylobacterium sp.]|jgi:hypothetical protein|nr:hypothetical protein [Phenylobacterium sp.]
MAPPSAAVMSPHPDPNEVVRIASADSRTILERLSGTDLVERGCVTVISVEAIRERAGPRWERKRDDVWAYVERKFDEHLSFQDIRHRINETDFLVAMTTEEGIAAQAISLKILEDVLMFFVGAAEAMDLNVRAVTEIRGDAITTTEVDLTRIAAARERPSAQPYQHEVDPREARRRSPISFVMVSGERVRVDFALEHVVSLRHNVTAALRVQPTVRSLRNGAVIPSAAFAGLADDDIAFIDRSTLDYGTLFMPKDVRNDPSLILPASFRTMGGRKGRNTLIGVEGTRPEQIRQGVMVELVDIDLGTPTARLAEVVGLLSQLCRGVLARLRPARDALAPVRGAKLHGLTFDAREFDLDDDRLARVLQAMALQARGKAPALIAQGLADPAWLARAHAAGFTHASHHTPPLTEGAANP